jgi:ectoine hydroxylase-related dioxygenase (phytanoyl-CoA dioxygenase family)
MSATYLTREQLDTFQRDGYIIVKGLVTPAEVKELNDHFTAMHAAGPVTGLFQPKSLEEAEGDMLKVYPRFMHPHRVDRLSKDKMLDPRFHGILRDLMDEEPIAAQSMYYFKPPGGRGQALHQDNFYLAVAPASCMAAWVALDTIDPDNGALFVVPGSHKTSVQCPHMADLTKSFSAEEVDIPPGLAPLPTAMEPGDVLFFNGSLIHGSFPNSSATRFRRSFICHYLPTSSTQISHYYFPLHRFDGTAIQIDEEVVTGVKDGGFCGSEHTAALANAWSTKVKLE